MRSVLLAVTLALATAACAAPAASPSAAPASASVPPPAPSAAGSPAGTPTATDSPAQPAGSQPPIAVPDPLNPMTHQRGEAVQVGDATVVFRGVEDRDGSLYAVFEIVSGSLPPARLLAVGATYALEPGAAANRLEAGPLPSDELATDTELTLNVGEQFVVFEAGEVLPAK